MMKIIGKLSLVLLLSMLPQFLFGNYIFVVLGLLLVGIVAFIMDCDKRLFKYLMILELIVSVFTFVLFKPRITYMEEAMQQFGVPFVVVFVLFNVLNVLILVYSGFKQGELVSAIYNKVFRKKETGVV